jgi:outer membrane autotransporter protein
MTAKYVRWLSACVGLVSLCVGSMASAQTNIQALIDDPAYAFTPIERIVAQRQIAALPELGRLLQGCADDCPADLTQTFGQLQNLDDYAFNVLDSGGGGGPSAQEQVRIWRSALRAQAPEEYSAQRAAVTEFGSNQMNNVMSRITALRGGAQGFAFNGMSSRTHTMAHRAARRGGAAGADDDKLQASRWGGFANVSYGFGSRDATGLENAFDFDGIDLTIGGDFRINNNFVAGLTLGYTDQSLEFDTSASQTVGGTDADGVGITAFALYEMDGPYVSGSLGWQMQNLESTRRVQYDLGFGAVNELQLAETDSSMLTATLDAGWAFNANAFGYEPYARFEYRNATIDGFRESGLYGVTVAERDVKSTLGILGFKAQYTITVPVGVLVPYIKAEFRKEFQDDPLQTAAYFNALALEGAPALAATFSLPSDTPDTSYYAASIGSSIVFRGGWQAFLQYQSVLALADVDSNVVTLGVRGEF